MTLGHQHVFPLFILVSLELFTRRLSKDFVEAAWTASIMSNRFLSGFKEIKSRWKPGRGCRVAAT